MEAFVAFKGARKHNHLATFGKLNCHQTRRLDYKANYRRRTRDELLHIACPSQRSPPPAGWTTWPRGPASSTGSSPRPPRSCTVVLPARSSRLSAQGWGAAGRWARQVPSLRVPGPYRSLLAHQLQQRTLSRPRCSRCLGGRKLGRGGDRVVRGVQRGGRTVGGCCAAAAGGAVGWGRTMALAPEGGCSGPGG